MGIAGEVPAVVAVKEASGSLPQMMEIISEVSQNGSKELENFSVLSGDDSLTLPLMAVGGRGCISVVANEAPKLFSDMVHLALSGDWKGAAKLHYLLLPLMNINFIESNPIPVKAAMSMMGLVENSLRLPLTSLEEKNRAQVEKALQGAGLL